MTTPLALPARPKILVITLRRLGDVLMTTPLIRTLRHAWPDAAIDCLLFAGSERILTGVPDIRDIVTIPQRPSVGALAALTRRLWRRYDLAVSTQSGDRPIYLATIAGRRRVGPVIPDSSGTWWKRRVLDRAAETGRDWHRYDELKVLADAVGVSFCPEVICPQGGSAEAIAPREPYAVLHPTPFEGYKKWSSSGWRELARRLAQRGLKVVVSEGRAASEQAYVESIFGRCDLPLIREGGRLDWPGLAALLKGAAVYIGIDTSMTHLAAATGCPTVALHGPTTPRRIGAWPAGGFDRLWEDSGTIQNRGNVWIVQNPLPCMPCQELGCERHLDSPSQCLQELGAAQVMVAVEQALAWGRGRRVSEWCGNAKAGMESLTAARVVQQ